MKKIPSVFVNKIDKVINNNEKIYFSKNEETTSIRSDSEEEKNPININKKIREIFDSPNYIYKADVEIKTKEGIINKRIIGKNKNYLITIDNELIPISDIEEIKNKNE